LVRAEFTTKEKVRKNKGRAEKDKDG